MKNLEKLVKSIYLQMLDFDNQAFDLMGEVISNPSTDKEEIDYILLSEKAILLENLLLDLVKDKEVLKNMIGKDINHIVDCFLISRRVKMKDNDFDGWNIEVNLFHSYKDADTFWNVFKKYI